MVLNNPTNNQVLHIVEYIQALVYNNLLYTSEEYILLDIGDNYLQYILYFLDIHFYNWVFHILFHS